MIEVRVEVRRSAEVPASTRGVFAVLSNVPDSAAHFPNVESLTPGDEGCYTWRLEKVRVGLVSAQTVYGCEYASDSEALTVTWTPIEGVGNSRVSGGWTIEPAGSGTRFTLEFEIVLSLDLPRMVRKVAEARAQRENSRLVGEYMDNLIETFSGGNGRLR